MSCLLINPPWPHWRTHSLSVTDVLTHYLSLTYSLTICHWRTHSLCHWRTHSLTVTDVLTHYVTDVLTHYLSLTYSLTMSLTYSLTNCHWRTHSLILSSYSLIDWLTDLLTLSLTYSLTHPFIHSLTHLLTHSLTHPLTHSLIHSIVPVIIALKVLFDLRDLPTARFFRHYGPYLNALAAYAAALGTNSCVHTHSPFYSLTLPLTNYIPIDSLLTPYWLPTDSPHSLLSSYCTPWEHSLTPTPLLLSCTTYSLTHLPSLSTLLSTLLNYPS